VLIRDRQPGDDSAIARIVDAAFEAVVGHVLFSILEVTIDGRSPKALALAPVGVQPDRQRRGIGRALIRTGFERARADGWEAVIVLGDPAYYRQFGFSAAQARHLEAPYSGVAFMALALQAGALDGRAGRVVYPPAFDLVA
jgi:putative acetyltransferase